MAKISSINKSIYGLIVIDGEMESADIEKVEAIADKFIDDGLVYILIDASKILFISSGDLSILIKIYNQCVARRGSLKLFDCSKFVSKLLRLARLEAVFPEYLDEKEASRNFRNV